ncbi:MAG: HAMP domain-containing histidine kinase, partial [Clostridium sp.]|nr:HAMP domain-containing histidine kinase [Clostridium sp.]
VEDMKASGRYLYIPGNTIRMESNLTDVPVNVAPYLEMWNPFGNNKYYLIVSVDTSYPNNDTYARQAAQYNSARDNFIVGMAGVVVGMEGCLATILLLMMMSGHTYAGSQNIRLYLSDETFTEVGLALWVIYVFACLYLGKIVGNRLISLFFKEDQWNYWIKLMKILVIYAGSMICFFGMIRRYKARTLWSNSLIKSVIDHTQDYRRRAAFAFGLGIGFAAVLFMNCALIWSMVTMFIIDEKSFKQKIVFCTIILFFTLFNLVIFHQLFSKAIQMDLLDGAIRSISQGNTSLQMDLERLNGKERVMGEHINNISIGLDAALQEKVKSERLKADLITNVSHDIKTPLTSIINYVDLLKREHIQDPKIQGYLEVLEQKSQRLKTLTEDLVEASKASSGNLKLEIADIDLVELVQQTGGEFAEKFECRCLEVVSHLPKEPMLIRADGRRMWRILENLYNNAFKYAMERSRIYVDVFQQDGRAVFTIKNVSESPLNISPDELTERFVRGDVSRTTEGSGLGLSIAKSLTQLQGGEFEVVIDGDLFKAVVSFPVKWTIIDECMDKLEEPKPESEEAGEPDKAGTAGTAGAIVPKSGSDNWIQ